MFSKSSYIYVVFLSKKNFKASVLNFPISETGRNYNSLFKLADNNWIIVMEQKRRKER